MKLHVSARNGYHQVSTPIKRILYISMGDVDVKLEFSQKIVEKYSNIKFHENPSHGS